MNINELEILRFLSGDANSHLESKINHWILESDENKAEFKLYQAIWNKSTHIPTVKEFDLDSEWMAIEEKINTSDPNTRPIIALKSSTTRVFRQQG